MAPVLSWKIVKGQQHLLVLLKTLGGLGIFGTVDTDKIIEVALCFDLIGCLSDLIQFGFRLCLQALWQLV